VSLHNVIFYHFLWPLSILHAGQIFTKRKNPENPGAVFGGAAPDAVAAGGFFSLAELFFQMSNFNAILYPTQMPANPPAAVRKIEDIEKTLPPQSTGAYPPAREPTIMPNITNVFIIYNETTKPKPKRQLSE
jgi:hypothetical protein